MASAKLPKLPTVEPSTDPDPDPSSGPPSEPPPPPKKGGKLKVSEWAKRKFGSRTLKGKQFIHPEAWKHAAAAALHCWPEHAHHAAAEMELTEEDYDAAIEAVLNIKPGKPGKVKRVNGKRTIVDAKPTTYEPHKPALSPHHERGLVNVKPEGL